MHRFFVPPAAIQGETLVLRGEIVHQVRDVLRLGAGEEILALDNLGAGYRVALETFGRDVVQGRILERTALDGEPRTRVILYQALIKSDKFEWVLQKGTELGVVAFVPLVTRRTVADRVGGSKWARWERIVIEAAEQSGRARVPSLREPRPLDAAIAEACDVLHARESIALMPYEREAERAGAKPLAEAIAVRPAQVHLFIGPEGGWDEAEVDAARTAGVQPVTLGPRILRAETAGLAVTAAILFACGDMQ